MNVKYTAKVDSTESSISRSISTVLTEITIGNESVQDYTETFRKNWHLCVNS